MRWGNFLVAIVALASSCGADFSGFFDGVLTQTLNCDDGSAGTWFIDSTMHFKDEGTAVEMVDGNCSGARFRDGGHPSIVEVDGAHTCSPKTENGSQVTVTIKSGTLARAAEILEVNLGFDAAVSAGGRNIACTGKWSGTLTRRWK